MSLMVKSVYCKKSFYIFYFSGSKNFFQVKGPLNWHIPPSDKNLAFTP